MMVAAGAPLDGTDRDDDDDGPGGGGGGAGRIRINADAIDTSGSLMSPSDGTTANTTGPTPM